jgi:hypothetical protein
MEPSSEGNGGEIQKIHTVKMKNITSEN